MKEAYSRVLRVYKLSVTMAYDVETELSYWLTPHCQFKFGCGELCDYALCSPRPRVYRIPKTRITGT